VVLLKKKNIDVKIVKLQIFIKNMTYVIVSFQNMSLLTGLRDRELTGVNASYQWLALRSLMHQFDQEWFVEHDDMQKLYLILCEMCIDQNIAKKVMDIIKKHEDEEIQSIVLTASRLHNDIELNNSELSECVLNIKSSVF
jgi:hypothetical protein